MRHFGVLQTQENVGRWDIGSMSPAVTWGEGAVNEPAGGGGC